MSQSTVLSAAAALHEFTAAQIAAYCEEDQAAVRRILRDHGGLFEPRPRTRTPRWRVSDPQGLRAAIAAAADAGPTPARLPDSGGSPQARLLLAEQTLVDCADAPSAAERRVMAATATNYLQQFVARALPGANPGTWWKVDPSHLDSVGDCPATETGTVSRCRLRTDFALARLTGNEAAEEKVGIGFLIDTAVELTRLVGSGEVDEERERRLSQRFADLARKLTTPSAPDDPGAVAPARLLSALAWRRAGPAVQGGCHQAAVAHVTLLRKLADGDPLVIGEGRSHLYWVLGPLRRGRQRVAVYQDLLDLLPSKFQFEPEEELLPGAVVTAVADADAARLLRHYAAVLEADLVNSPYLSDRALVGQVVHRFEEFTVLEADRDSSVVARTTETHKELLALFDVDV